MKLVGAIVLISMGVVFGTPDEDSCPLDVSREVSEATLDFSLKLYKAVAKYHNNQFVLAPYSIWMTLAAIAEGASESAQEKLFNALKLPKKLCVRQSYYKTMKKHERLRSDMELYRTRLLGYDESLHLNETWSSEVHDAGLLDTVSLPILSDPELAIERLSNYSMSSLNDIKLKTKSVLVDSLDYSGIWSVAFPNALIEHDAPFYNDDGKIIGKVDYIHIKRRMKFGYWPDIKMKAVEIPVDKDGLYSLLFYIPTDYINIETPISMLTPSIVEQVVVSMHESSEPVEIALPKVEISSHHDDVHLLLEQLGLQGLFSDPSTTKYVSNPPAMPGAFVQRVAVKMDVIGEEYKPKKDNYSLPDTSSPKDIANPLYINRPFMFVFMNAKSKVAIFCGAFSRP